MNRRTFLLAAGSGLAGLLIDKKLQQRPEFVPSACACVIESNRAASGPVDLLRLEATPPYVEAGTPLTASLQFRNRSPDSIPLENLDVVLLAYDTQKEILTDGTAVTGELEPKSTEWIPVNVYPDSEPGDYMLFVEYGPQSPAHVVERNPSTDRPTPETDSIPDGATIQ